MALNSNFDKLCPLFDFNNSGAVVFPYFPLALQHSAGGAKGYIDFDDTASLLFARIRFGFDVRLITCEALAASDASGTKAAAASAEPVIGIVYGTAALASIDAGTSCAVITCDLTGDIGHRWAGTTTPVTISSGQELIVHLKTACASATSANMRGGAVPVLWFALVNAP